MHKHYLLLLLKACAVNNLSWLLHSEQLYRGKWKGFHDEAEREKCPEGRGSAHSRRQTSAILQSNLWGKKAQTLKSLRGNVWYLFNLEKSLKAASVQTARNNLQYKNTEVSFHFRTLTLICLYTSTETSQFPQLTCSN